MINFNAFGTLDLRESDGTTVDSVLSQPKRLAVLLYLALASPGGFVRRDTLLALFWPDSDTARARNSLSKTLSFLRKALGEDVVVTRGNEEIGLDPERIRCDVVAFDEAIDAGRLEDALELYQGDLAPGFHADASVEFEQWLEAERKRRRQAALATARKLAGHAREAGRLQVAVAWARQARYMAPLSERAVGDLVEALAATGDRTAALDVFEAFSDRLAAEYELEPSAELAERVQAIADGSAGPAAAGRPAGELRAASAGPTDPARSARLTSGDAAATSSKAAGTVSDSRSARDSSPGKETGANALVRRRGTILAVLGVLVTAAVGYVGLRAAGIAPVGALMSGGTVTHSDQILITDFASPGDEMLGATAAALLRTDFSMSNLLNIPSEREVAGAMDRMRAEGSKPDSALAVELAVREGYELVALGQIIPVGSGYVITARLVMPESGEVLGRFRVEAEESDDFVDAVDALSADIHRRIGESRARIRRLPPLAQVSTSSLEALTAYTQGARLNTAGRYEEAIPFLEHAIASDSAFGEAYRKLSVVLTNWGGGWDRRDELRALAYQHRGRMTPYRRLHLESLFESLEARDTATSAASVFGTGIQKSEDFLRLYPRETAAWHNLGDTYIKVLRYEDAIAANERVLREDSTSLISWYNLALARAGAGDFQGAERDLERLRPNPDMYYDVKGIIALTRGDVPGARAAWVRSSDPRFSVTQVAIADAALGQLDAAQERLRSAAAERMESLQPQWILENAAWLALVTGTLEPERAEEARRVVDNALRTYSPDSFPTPYGAAHLHARIAGAYAAVGDADRARHHIRRLNQVHGGTLAEWAIGLWARGLTLLHEDRAEEAIHILEDGPRSWPRSARMLRGLLGRAYEASGMPDSAVAVYERSLVGPTGWPRMDYRWIVRLPLTHRALGRLYEANGDTAQAVEHYAHFIDLWRDADPELQPQVEAARNRLEALRSDRRTRAPPTGDS